MCKSSEKSTIIKRGHNHQGIRGSLENGKIIKRCEDHRPFNFSFLLMVGKSSFLPTYQHVLRPSNLPEGGPDDVSTYESDSLRSTILPFIHHTRRRGLFTRQTQRNHISSRIFDPSHEKDSRMRATPSTIHHIHTRQRTVLRAGCFGYVRAKKRKRRNYIV